MSDERTKKNEVVSLDHSFHRHPLVLSEFEGKDAICWGCTRNIYNGEMLYGCRDGCPLTLHEECAEMPREIKLLMHPQHALIHSEIMMFPNCSVCERDMWPIGYYCSSWYEGCRFQVHGGCAYNMRVLQRCIDHPSHPQHQLMMLRRPARSIYSLRCDACGTIEKGNSYICTACQYWIHESCAELSATVLYRHHHHHHLSLIYNLPPEYIKYSFRCDICFKALVPKYWAYHCGICRYVVHIKCAIKTTLTTDTINNDAVEHDEDVIVFPLKNGVEELISSFVIKIGVNPDQLNHQSVNGKHKFHNHDHQLRLISSSSLHHQEEVEEEVEENSDEDDFNSGDQSKLVCDGCTMPIFPKKPESPEKYGSNYYMSCGECRYFLHWACFHLPPQIPSHPLHYLGHNLILQTCPKLSFVNCRICHISTNGLFYECASCSFKVDIKCASLPNTIKHKSHSRHNLKLMTEEHTRNFHYWLRTCSACDTETFGYTCYECDACKIILHSSCALLPAFVTNRAWDKHRLPLTFNASANHPSSFCCDICEGDMNPKSWMYHCRTCDLSVLPECFPTASGEYQNTKFGQQYAVASIHHHPIAYQLLTKKLHCDVCGHKKDYGCQGFQCVSNSCDFFMCLNPCAANHLVDMHDRLIEENPSSDQ